MGKIKVLWIDDEIELLKPHIIFLEQKNYIVHTCLSGSDALDLIHNNHFDIVFLDENMPGLSGLETLNEIKELKSDLPVVMITKSEEEMIMEEAIGRKIADYLIKPVNPNQILLSIKKTIDQTRLVSEKATAGYQQEFRNIAMDLGMVSSYKGWIELYQKLIFWELELQNIDDQSILEILMSQKLEANNQFGKFIEKNYKDWLNGGEGPLLSHEVFKQKVAPEINTSSPTLLLVIDNLRYDQWKMIEPVINNHYNKENETPYYSILPTATQYARNAFFSGLTPLEMEKQWPQFWKNDTDEGGKNLFEKEFLDIQLKRLGKRDINYSYHKITNFRNSKKLIDQFENLKHNDLNVVVYNFVDMLSHAKTEIEVIKELASDDKAYRSLTLSWFKNSPLLEMIQLAQQNKFKLIFTTDHGTINVKHPSKVIGDRETSLNTRYKTGKSLSFQEKEVMLVKNPNDAMLPTLNLNSSFIFAKNDFFFAYPNNYNHYVSYFRNSYQHGGISLEEMIIPFAVFSPK